LEDYWSATSRALENLLVAAGRESGIGVLGGLRGALATTDLGIPPDAQVVSGCSGPPAAPAYGVAKGYLVYVAIPSGPGPTRLPEAIGARAVSLHGNMIVVHTAATDLIGELCPKVQEAAAMTGPSHAGPSSEELAALYTEQQARQGEQVYKQSCASCHGGELQGVSAPPVGGKRFMTKAKILEWSVDDMRNLVVSSMPVNNPRSLSDKQYADVLAYLLAVNCYPAGNTPFPIQSTPALKSAHLQPVQGAKGEDQKTAMCPVRP
jgi:mono/diheme cytochrome c family protein